MNQQSQSRRPRGIELPPRTPAREASNQTDDWGWGSQSHGYYNRSAYAPDYTEIDSGPYEMEHMSHVTSRHDPLDLPVIPNEDPYEVVPRNELVPVESPPHADVQPKEPEMGYTGLMPTQPEQKSKCRGHCRIVWLVVLAFLLLLLVTVLLLLVVFGGEYNHK